MSYLTDTDFNKRAGNIYVAFIPVSAVAQTMEAVSGFNSGEMIFEAVYLADFPTALPLGGAWSAVNIGSNVALSGANRVATFIGTGTVISDTMQNIVGAPRMFEYVLNFDTGAPLIGLGHWPGNGIAPVFNGELYLGGSSPAGGVTVYENDGSIEGFLPPKFGLPYSGLTAIGVVIDSSGANYYQNGVFQEFQTFGNVFVRGMATMA